MIQVQTVVLVACAASYGGTKRKTQFDIIREERRKFMITDGSRVTDAIPRSHGVAQRNPHTEQLFDEMDTSHLKGRPHLWEQPQQRPSILQNRILSPQRSTPTSNYLFSTKQDIWEIRPQENSKIDASKEQKRRLAFAAILAFTNRGRPSHENQVPKQDPCTLRGTQKAAEIVSGLLTIEEIVLLLRNRTRQITDAPSKVQKPGDGLPPQVGIPEPTPADSVESTEETIQDGEDTGTGMTSFQASSEEGPETESDGPLPLPPVTDDQVLDNNSNESNQEQPNSQSSEDGEGDLPIEGTGDDQTSDEVSSPNENPHRDQEDETSDEPTTESNDGSGSAAGTTVDGHGDKSTEDQEETSTSGSEKSSQPAASSQETPTNVSKEDSKEIHSGTDEQPGPSSNEIVKDSHETPERKEVPDDTSKENSEEQDSKTDRTEVNGEGSQLPFEGGSGEEEGSGSSVKAEDGSSAEVETGSNEKKEGGSSEEKEDGKSQEVGTGSSEEKEDGSSEQVGGSSEEEEDGSSEEKEDGSSEQVSGSSEEEEDGSSEEVGSGSSDENDGSSEESGESSESTEGGNSKETEEDLSLLSGEESSDESKSNGISSEEPASTPLKAQQEPESYEDYITEEQAKCGCKDAPVLDYDVDDIEDGIPSATSPCDQKIREFLMRMTPSDISELQQKIKSNETSDNRRAMPSPLSKDFLVNLQKMADVGRPEDIGSPASPSTPAPVDKPKEEGRRSMKGNESPISALNLENFPSPRRPHFAKKIQIMAPQNTPKQPYKILPYSTLRPYVSQKNQGRPHQKRRSYQGNPDVRPFPYYYAQPYRPIQTQYRPRPVINNNQPL